MDAVFRADSVVEALLRFESALALGLADAGIAPPEEAEAVAAACRAAVDDAESLLATTWETGTPLIAVVDLIRSRLELDDEKRWVHHGATTQDAIDSAHMILSRRALGILDEGLVGIAGRMRELIDTYRDQPQMARTFLQDARPTTFGLRVAGWLEPLLSQIEALREVGSGLTLQLGGPVGNLSAYGPNGVAVARAVARRLELDAPDLPWHADRSRIRSLVSAVTEPVHTLAKMATDVGLLAQSAIAEVGARPGSSSSMPGKENPIDAIRLLAAADLCEGSAAMVTGARPHELDRGLGSWHVEWVALPWVFQSASAAVDAADTLLATLEVDGAAMTARAGEEVPQIDPTIIDSILDHHSRVIGGGA